MNFITEMIVPGIEEEATLVELKKRTKTKTKNMHNKYNLNYLQIMNRFHD